MRFNKHYFSPQPERLPHIDVARIEDERLDLVRKQLHLLFGLLRLLLRFLLLLLVFGVLRRRVLLILGTLQLVYLSFTESGGRGSVWKILCGSIQR